MSDYRERERGRGRFSGRVRPAHQPAGQKMAALSGVFGQAGRVTERQSSRAQVLAGGEKQ
ncbi:MAG: hypothetical protein M3133_08010 [Actinomycetota bacterium]|nr:hypothetical protein [Actinomycetota bacterium]